MMLCPNQFWNISEKCDIKLIILFPRRAEKSECSCKIDTVVHDCPLICEGPDLAVDECDDSCCKVVTAQRPTTSKKKQQQQ